MAHTHLYSYSIGVCCIRPSPIPTSDQFAVYATLLDWHVSAFSESYSNAACMLRRKGSCLLHNSGIRRACAGPYQRQAVRWVEEDTRKIERA
jgi:hypothetical protein